MTTTIKPFPRRISGPSVEPITLAEALVHLHEFSDSGGPIDQTVTRMIKSARTAFERITERTLIDSSWRLKLDTFPATGAIELLHPPVINVTSVTYLDAAGASRTVNPADYVVDTASEPGWLVPAPGKTWPTTQEGAINAVTIDYTAGYGSNAASVPEDAREWMFLVLTRMNENRGWDVPDDFAPGRIDAFRILG